MPVGKPGRAAAKGSKPVISNFEATPAVLLSTYAHLLPELAEAKRVEAELEIVKGRAKETRRMCVPSRLSGRASPKQQMRRGTKAADRQWFSGNGSDGTRTRDLCRDRAAL